MKWLFWNTNLLILSQSKKTSMVQYCLENKIQFPSHLQTALNFPLPAFPSLLSHISCTASTVDCFCRKCSTFFWSLPLFIVFPAPALLTHAFLLYIHWPQIQFSFFCHVLTSWDPWFIKCKMTHQDKSKINPHSVILFRTIGQHLQIYKSPSWVLVLHPLPTAKHQELLLLM